MNDLVALTKNVDLVGLIGKDVRLVKVSAREYAGPCVRCGGRDRFRLNLDRGWFCRQCQEAPDSGGHWHDAIDYIQFRDGLTFVDAVERLTGRRQVTPEEAARIEEMHRQHVAELERQEAETRKAAADELTTSGDWQRYNANLKEDPRAREYWRVRGIADDWQDYYGLGYCPERDWKAGSETVRSASLTIPYFIPVVEQHPGEGDDYTWRVIDLKHRLLMTDAPGGKYRHHIAGCGNNLFVTDLFVHPERLFADVLIVEGEIKAMVVNACLYDEDNCHLPSLTVIGVPGKNWKPEWIAQFQRAERVFVCLDPDAYKDAGRLASMIGEQARNILLPEKIDDLILAGALNRNTLRRLFDGAWR